MKSTHTNGLSQSKLLGFALAGLAPSGFGHRKSSQVHANRKRNLQMGRAKHANRNID